MIRQVLRDGQVDNGAERKVIRPESMAFFCAEILQHRACAIGVTWPLGVIRVAKDSNKSVFREWTSGPPHLVVDEEKGFCLPVVLVIGIGKRYQNIDVQQEHATR
jgi:hypothetical protein